MSLFDLKLFWGIPIDTAFSIAIAKTNPHALKMFINNESTDYLHRIQHKNISYIGKELPSCSSTESLTLLENNIYSILHKLVKEYDFSQNPARLLVLTTDIK